MSLVDALGGMRSIAHWFLWRLVWDQEEQKYQKTPCALDGSVYRMDAGNAANWNAFDVVHARAAQLNASTDMSLRYALGFWLTADCGYWFFDLDKVSPGDGSLTEHASAMMSMFPGAMLEWSSSCKGLHIIGRTVGQVPPHRSRAVRESGLDYEFYTEGRGIAFGLSGLAAGNADTTHDVAVAQLVAAYFPPREQNEGRRNEWRGPEDDDELIRRALQAKRSAEAAFGGKASFADLWHGNAEKNSNNDMALASHLAFWTGCDEERIERLMRKSGMFREKWNVHRTYLRDLTIANACAQCTNVYQEPVRSDEGLRAMVGELVPMPTPEPGVVVRAPAHIVSPETLQRVEELLDLVHQAPDQATLYNSVFPAIRASQIPPAFQDRIVRVVNKQLDAAWDAKMGVAKLRAILFPPVVQGSRDAAPDWALRHCYVKDGDYFFDTENGASMTYQGFNAEFMRSMPIKDNGSRENAAEWALTRWGMTTVHRTGYRPDQGRYYTWDGFDYANLYNPASVPTTATAYTEAGLRGIEAFQQHLYDMCGRRDNVFRQLIFWLAHNVQKPGIKIRWSPIIKGTHGDGKSLLAAVIRAVMGYRNVGVTGNSTLSNNGGFNDWAIGKAVNIIEEIMLTGKEKHKLYNATQEFIANDIVSINPKGAKAYDAYNTTNHLAYTNHNNAIPLAKEDRRWLVIFTPWASLADMLVYCGLTEEGWKARSSAVDHAFRHCAGELRLWLLTMEIGPEFDRNASALRTPERLAMIATSSEDAETVAAQIIEDGCHGVSKNVFSSACLNHMLKVRSLQDGFELPKTTALNHMLSRLGYSRYEKLVKWKNGVHTIWFKDGFKPDNESIRLELDNSQPNSLP